MGGSEDDGESCLTPTRECSNECLRKRTADEVLESEKKYLAQLRLLTEHFVEPLCGGKILSGADAAAIFSNVAQIKLVSEMLLSELQRTSVGEAFVSLCPFLKQYALYASNYQRAMNALTSLSQKQGPFVEFLRQQECRPELQGLKLISLLITPVQRMPRYKLLLERLLKHTDESADSGSVEKLKEAVRQVAEVTEYVNQQVSVYASMHRAVEIQRCLSSTGDGSRTIELLKPWRALLKEGVLRKVSEKSGRSSQRSVFLFTDVLMYARSERGGGYSHVVLLELKHLYASRGRAAAAATAGSGKWSGGSGAGSAWWADGQLQSRALQVSCREKKLLLVAQRETEAIAWFSAIQAAVSQCRQCLQSLRRARPGSGHIASATASPEPGMMASLMSAVGGPTESCRTTSSSAAGELHTPAKLGSDQASPTAEAAAGRSVLSVLSPGTDTWATPPDSPAARLSGAPSAAPRRRRRPHVSATAAEQGTGDAILTEIGNQVSVAKASSGCGGDSADFIANGLPVGQPQTAGCCDLCVGHGPLDGRRRKRSPGAQLAPGTVESGVFACEARCTAADGGGLDRSAEPERTEAADVTTEANDKHSRQSKWKKRCDFFVKAGRIISQVVTSPILPVPQPPLFSPGLFND